MWQATHRFDLETIRAAMIRREIQFVERMMFCNDRAWTIFITSQDDWTLMCKYYMVNEDYPCWFVTSCNKQYVSMHLHGHHDVYLGCMQQITAAEAHAVRDANNPNWVLKASKPSCYWTPVMQNPNRMIPGAEMSEDGNEVKFPVQDRPWPLQSDTYEQWKAGVMANVMAMLEKEL
jgi:hypothetical protein